MAINKDAKVKKVQIKQPANGKQYTQSEFYDALNEYCNLGSRRVAKAVYGGFAELIKTALKRGYKLPLPGIGKILVRQTNPRIGRNPMTGEQIKIPAKKRVRLTPSKALKDAVL
ncbi:MAG: HU family DNA-binding protein [Deltaproteobacteria bacterium]|nr:HU family DNA-binding protein [Deltaproteobacteria bacterium]